jgi:hypothetical protein
LANFGQEKSCHSEHRAHRGKKLKVVFFIAFLSDLGALGGKRIRVFPLEASRIQQISKSDPSANMTKPFEN